MSVDVNPHNRGFQIGMLFSDERYRGLTLQFLATLAIALGVGWLGTNLLANMQEQGKDIDFGFLFEQSGYDIYPKLIEVNSISPHIRVAIAGVLNTLLVAFLGCIAATILGVTVGVLRLSNNWIVARLMSFYVEIFRNIPLLIWIIIIVSIFSLSMPSPLAYGGAEPEYEMFLGAFAFTSQGIFGPAPVFGPGSGLVVGVFFASLAAMWGWRRYARRKLYDEGRELPVGWVLLALFFVPTLVAFFVMGRPITLDPVEVGRFTMTGGMRLTETLIALWAALSLYTGAFIAESVRGGILAVSKGQTEAAAALGLRPNRIMNLVVLPQALRVIIPPLISQYLNLTKNSSLAAAIGYPEIMGTLGGVTLNQTGRSFEAVLIIMGIYLTISLTISAVLNVYNNTVKLKER